MFNRRTFLGFPLLLLVTESLASEVLDTNDPTAKALGYVADAAKVDAKTNPTYKAGQRCDNCIHYTGKAGSSQGGCNLFPGKEVKAGGWCKVYVKKPN